MRNAGRKIQRLVLTVLAVSFLTFLLTSLLPGDPARQILGDQATPDAVAAVRGSIWIHANHEACEPLGYDIEIERMGCRRVDLDVEFGAQGLNARALARRYPLVAAADEDLDSCRQPAA